MRTMKKLLCLVSLSLGLASCSTHISPSANLARYPSSNTCSTKNECVQNFLRDIIKTYRPSGEEEKARDYIKKKILAALPLWSNEKPTMEEDHLGNLLVRVPATGRFANQSLRPIVLQSHLDIIHAVKGAKPGEDLRSYFSQGVDLVEEIDGWWHSRDFKTSLGADNGTGIAISLAYGVDPAIEHPPLYLLFTVQEETGLKGALGLNFSLDNAIIINLDSLDADRGLSLVRGGSGGNSNRIKGKVEAVSLPDSWATLEISIKGLLGGHSGHDIAKSRVNGLILLSRLYTWLREMNVTASIAYARAGQLANQIPATLDVRFALASNRLPENLEKLTTKWIEDEICMSSEECKNDKRQVTVYLNQRPVDKKMLDVPFTERLLSTILAMPNGVLTGNPDSPEGVITSNNVGALVLEPISESMNFHTEFAFFTRSFVNLELSETVAKITSAYYGLYPEGALTTTNNLNVFGWVVPLDSWLVRLAMSGDSSPFPSATMSSGSNESGVLVSRYRGVSLISLGARVQNAHTSNEKLDVDSFIKLDAFLRDFVVRIGMHPNGVQ